jgi:FKBP-type peptidyl-prolyl cis-trans isomerase 2
VDTVLAAGRAFATRDPHRTPPTAAEGSPSVDSNHPLAGVVLYVQSRVTSIRDGTDKELESGCVAGASPHAPLIIEQAHAGLAYRRWA